MTDIQRINPGSRMSQAVIHNGTIYLSGQVGTPEYLAEIIIVAAL